MNENCDLLINKGPHRTDYKPPQTTHTFLLHSLIHAPSPANILVNFHDPIIESWTNALQGKNNFLQPFGEPRRTPVELTADVLRISRWHFGVTENSNTFFDTQTSLTHTLFLLFSIYFFLTSYFLKFYFLLHDCFCTNYTTFFSSINDDSTFFLLCWLFSILQTRKKSINNFFLLRC